MKKSLILGFLLLVLSLAFLKLKFPTNLIFLFLSVALAVIMGVGKARSLALLFLLPLLPFKIYGILLAISLVLVYLNAKGAEEELVKPSIAKIAPRSLGISFLLLALLLSLQLAPERFEVPDFVLDFSTNLVSSSLPCDPSLTVRACAEQVAEKQINEICKGNEICLKVMESRKEELVNRSIESLTQELGIGENEVIREGLKKRAKEMLESALEPYQKRLYWLSVFLLLGLIQFLKPLVDITLIIILGILLKLFEVLKLVEKGEITVKKLTWVID